MLNIDLELKHKFNVLIPPQELSNKDYHKKDGISSSGLKQAYKDPKLYFNREKLLRMPSTSLNLGSALHDALLTPNDFNVDFYDLTPANLKKLDIMINNAKVMFDYIVSKTINEHSLFVQDNGFIRKVRPDAYDKSLGVIYDVKTTKHINKTGFEKDIYDYGYHLQAAYYIDTMRMAGLKVEYFCFLVVPNDSPCEPFAAQLTDRFIEEGRAIYSQVLENILSYTEPTNKEKVFFHQADLPKWRLEQLGQIA